jgi:hypothetical protein
MLCGVPFPSAPWQATHPLLKICFPFFAFGGFGYLSVCASSAADAKNNTNPDATALFTNIPFL